MAEERRAIDSFSSGGDWSASLTDIDELVVDADGSVASTTVDDSTCTVTFATGSVGDADTVTEVQFQVRARAVGAGTKDTIGVTFDGTEVNTGFLTGALANYTLSSAGNWDVTDYTAAQLAANVTVAARQTGKAESATWEVDCIDMVITYTPAGGGGDFKSRFALMGVG